MQIIALDASLPLTQALKFDLAAAPVSHVHHIYHFATPPINKSPSCSWSPALFDSFCWQYLHGFAVIALATVPSSAGAPVLEALLPPTEFLEPSLRGFAEYCATKAAG